MTTLIAKDRILDQLGELVRRERLLEKLLERASRSDLDPREVAYLWNLATQCRDHARILSRHRREVDRAAEQIPYPLWARGKGPRPEEALDILAEVSQDLAGEYRSSTSLMQDPYLRKFLVILSEEHDRRVIELKGLARGACIFEDIEELAEDEQDS